MHEPRVCTLCPSRPQDLSRASVLGSAEAEGRQGSQDTTPGLVAREEPSWRSHTGRSLRGALGLPLAGAALSGRTQTW